MMGRLRLRWALWGWSLAASLLAPLLLGNCGPLDDQTKKDLETILDGGTVNVKFEMHFERFDPASGSFEVLKPPSVQRNLFTAQTVGQKLVVVGGLNEQGNYTRAVEVYDPATDSWSGGASWTRPRTSWFLPVSDSLLCAIGGFEGANVFRGTTAVDCYDVTTDTWSSRAALPEQVDNIYPVAFGGKIYVLGGTINQKSDFVHPTDTSLVYDPATDSWAQLSKPPAPRGLAAVHAVGNKIYIVGGFSKDLLGSRDNKPEERSMLVYDPAENSWSLSPQMPNTRWLFGSEAVGNNLVVFFGLGASNLLDSYDPAQDAWTSKPDPSQTLSPGVYTSVVHKNQLYFLVLADKISSSKLSASGKLWKHDLGSNQWAIAGQRGADDRDALFIGSSLGDSIYFTGAFTQIKISSKTPPGSGQGGSAGAGGESSAGGAAGESSAGAAGLGQSGEAGAAGEGGSASGSSGQAGQAAGGGDGGASGSAG